MQTSKLDIVVNDPGKLILKALLILAIADRKLNAMNVNAV